MNVRNITFAAVLSFSLTLSGQTPGTGDSRMSAEPQLKVFTNSGTTNRLAMFASDGTVVDSNVYQVGTKLGINTSSIVNVLTIDAGAATSDGIRLSRVSQTANPYMDLTLNTAGTPFGVIQVGEANGGVPRALVLQPNGGKIGINTLAPGAPLHLFSNATADTSMSFGPDPAGASLNIGYSGSYARGTGFINVRGDASTTAPNPSLRLLTQDVPRMIITNAGHVGIGTDTPPHPLDVYGPPTFNPPGGGGVREVLGIYDSSTFGADAGAAIAFGGRFNSAGNYAQQFASIQGYKENATDGDYAGALRFYTRANGGNPVERMRIASTGTVYVNGDLVATGNLAAKYQDVAEWVPSSSDLAPGTVVVLDPLVGNGIVASHAPYDTMVAGVVSSQPGLILGEGGAGKEQIATTGRVRVKVDATAAPIRVGDLLVTSDRSGYAMRSIPVDVSGISMHRPGTIVGKALEPLNGGQGEILVLLSLQ